eukprot:768727-Hanusia_phi.AAC.3
MKHTRQRRPVRPTVLLASIFPERAVTGSSFQRKGNCEKEFQNCRGGGQVAMLVQLRSFGTNVSSPTALEQRSRVKTIRGERSGFRASQAAFLACAGLETKRSMVLQQKTLSSDVIEVLHASSRLIMRELSQRCSEVHSRTGGAGRQHNTLACPGIVAASFLPKFCSRLTGVDAD